MRPFLDPGESAVGTAVDVRHFAATPLGRDVRATAEVVNVEGKRIDFKVSASDGIEEIGSGTYQRIVIDLRSFNERLAKKKVATNAARSALGINDEPRRRAVFCGRLGSAFSGPSTVNA
jgi:predicted thioesterase